MDGEMNGENRETDNEKDGQIEGYQVLSSAGSQPDKNKSRQEQDEDEEDDLDHNDFERIVSRSDNYRFLSLLDAPEFVQRLRAYDEVKPGDTVTFSAQYRAYPKPTVKWFKDEEEVRATERHQLDAVEDDIIRLTINDVVASDEGAYKCKVENQEGVASTTGYLSVMRKPSHKSRSGRSISGKLSPSSAASQGVSTPPYLGPITEQKSMEEREEMELSQQPPSPLQDFIDSIRHSAKEKHAPIFYGTGDIFTVTATDDDYSEVFDDGSDTPTETSTEISQLNEEDFSCSTAEDATDSFRIHALDSFVSPSIDWNQKTKPDNQSGTRIYSTQISNDDSAYDSDNNSSTQGDNRELQSDESLTFRSSPSEFHRRRLGQLQLKHRLAIDLSEYSPTHRSLSSENSSKDEDEEMLSSDELTTNQNINPSSASLHNISFLDDLSKNSSEIQFHVIFIVLASCLALHFNVPAIGLVFAVALLSLVRFGLCDRQIRNAKATKQRHATDRPAAQNGE